MFIIISEDGYPLKKYIDEVISQREKLKSIDDLLRKISSTGEGVQENLKISSVNISDAEQLTFEAKELLDVSNHSNKSITLVQ